MIKKIFCIGLLFLGIAVFLYGVFPLYFSYQSASWESVPGTVVQSKLTYTKGITRAKKGSRTGKYFADIVYKYFVNGAQYKNSEIFYGYIGNKSSNDAKFLLDLYPIDSNVDVYFDNSNPERSVLQSGINPSVWRYPAIGLTVIFVSILGIVSILKKKKNIIQPD